MQPEKSFLGTGWHFPPAFGAGGIDVSAGRIETEDGNPEEMVGGKEIEMVSGAEDIHQSLQILFSTHPGERVMQDTFGCDLGNYVFEEIDQSLINSLHRTITDAILYHEPRITLDRLQISESPSESGLLLINLEYTVRGTNSRYNMVYPFYLNEAVMPGF